MDTRRYKNSAIVFLSAMSLTANAEVNLIKTSNLETDSNSIAFSPLNANVTKVGESGSDYLIVFDSTPMKSQVSFKPSSAWDFSKHKGSSLMFTIENQNAESTHIKVKVTDSSGKATIRNISLPANSTDNYYFELRGDDLTFDNGMREGPEHAMIDAKKLIFRGGSDQLDVENISEIVFYIDKVFVDKTIKLSNISVVHDYQYNDDYLSKIVDNYGQSTSNVENKVTSDSELVQRAVQERKQLSGSAGISDRSKFGGWKNGPKLEGSGYFRAEKIGDIWSLVDPEGYLYFATGIANIRMANTVTMTGFDFLNMEKDERYDEYTPDDSSDIHTVDSKTLETRQITAQHRARMFSWLPEYNSPLAKHFGYRFSVHSGGLEKGETFSFYQANLERKYGDNYYSEWQDITLNRMLDWGFTSLGNWTASSFYTNDKVPYFANGWIIGDFATVSSGNDMWSPLPDPFDPVFKERTLATVRQIGKEVNDNPWCVGIFVDNEMSWGVKGLPESQYGIALNALKNVSAVSPAKAAFVDVLKSKYADIDVLSNRWGIDFDSWESVNQPIEFDDYSPELISDLAMLTERFAAKYFSTVQDAIKTYLPNHMYMGARFADWGMTPEVLEAAKQHVDVMSYNYYREHLHQKEWAFLDDLDMPSIMGEFHIGATDTGFYNPGLVHAENQQERGIKYVQYMNSVIDNPYFVGAHWFQYIDSPITGRAHDGENYNIGFVDVTDTPYKHLVDAARELNSSLYPRKFTSINK